MGRERLQVLISFVRNSRVGQKGEVGTSLAYNVHGKVGYLLLQKQFTTKMSGLMEWFIIVFLDSVGWLCSTRWFSHRVSHVVAVRWQLGPRPSEGLTGLDIWDGSLPWPALDVGLEFSCDCQPESLQAASLWVCGFLQMVDERKCPTSKNSKRTKKKLLWLLMT